MGRDKITSSTTSTQYTATNTGSGSIAQGAGAVAAGAGGIAAQSIGNANLIVTGDHNQVIVGDDPQAKLLEARRRYLRRLRRACEALPLAALGGEEGADVDLTLDRVYIDLDTLTPVPLTDAEKQQRGERAFSGRDQDTRPLSALEAAIQSSRLALLGDPGAGKSTFARKLLAWLAAAQLGESEPPPGLSRDLLPILIVLRDLASRLAAIDFPALSSDQQQSALATAVSDQAISDLARYEAAGFTAGLQDALNTGQCLLVLDGLDEVPYDLRARVRQAASAVLSQYRVQRVILTCRIRSYVGEVVLPNFQAHTLAPFDQDKIQGFAAAWYNAQKELGRVDADQARHKAENLSEAALSEDLRELAENPMILTTMAIIHQREIGLPKERVRLYALAVDVLLRRWQKRKAGEAGLTPSTALADFLKDDLRLRDAMEQLAYQAHRAGRGQKASSDLPRGDALTLLEQPEYLGQAGLAAEFLDYVDQRAGLLVGRGGEWNRPSVYSFPHRTFQEYLAGCYLSGRRDVARELFAHAGEGDYWDAAARHGLEDLLYNRRGQNPLLNLAYQLCPAGEPASTQARRATLWSGLSAMLIGCEAVERDQGGPEAGATYLTRLVPRLLNLLSSDLTAPERADAGLALAQLGDPRFQSDRWCLPDGPLLGFVPIPAGAFLMGSDKAKDPQAFKNEEPQHPVSLRAYYIGRYPVTVAQFKAFVEDSGRAPEDEDSLKGPCNHPVVNLTWHEMIAYCNWLNDRLRALAAEQLSGTGLDAQAIDFWRGLREQRSRVTLPSEAEWEKAARGTDSRVYPWGDQPDPDQANYAATGIGTTSTVGCFPMGASPYGVLDLSGNVWEWTRSHWKDYPYDQNDGREALDAPDNIGRVLRGGAFFNVEGGVRCAYRDFGDPLFRDWGDGFRVVVVPF